MTKILVWHLYFMSLCLQMSSVQLVKLNFVDEHQSQKNEQLPDFSLKLT